MLALGIPHELKRGWWGWQLHVDDDDAAEARHQLALYESENAPRSRAGPAVVATGARLGVVIYVAVLSGLFLLQGRSFGGIDWTSAGRVDVALIRAGEWWRVLTALTLHIDVGHLAGNLGFGAIFGALLGRQLGGGLAWLAILLAGGLGNLINVWIQGPQHWSVGASTAVFGAVGLLATFGWLTGRAGDESWARRWFPLIAGAWVLAWLGTGDERTDIVAHLTGFLAGGGLGLLLAAVGPAIYQRRSVQLLAGGVALVGLSAGWFIAISM